MRQVPRISASEGIDVMPFFHTDGALVASGLPSC